MTYEELLDHAVCASRAAHDSTRKQVLDEFRDLVDRLRSLVELPGTPEGTRGKAQKVLDLLAARREEYGARAFLPAFLLNFVGEAMVRAEFIHETMIRFLKTGLYFYGVEYIERRLRAQATQYMALQVDVSEDFFGRDSLKGLIADGQARLGASRPFCIVHAYVNVLRKAYWAWRKQATDALDAQAGGEPAVESAPAPSETPYGERLLGPAERIRLMIGLFTTKLTDMQRRIYVAKNGAALRAGLAADTGADADPGAVVDRWMRSFEDPAAGAGGDEKTWPEIARELGVNEKTAKREYLKGLHSLLKECHRALFGGESPTGAVRRVLDALRAVIDEKDLRLKDKTGRGLGTLVERWELALRWLLNHTVDMS